MATLVLTGDVTVGRTKDYIQADLWKKQCFIQLDLDKDPDQAVKQTFSFLLTPAGVAGFAESTPRRFGKYRRVSAEWK